MPKIKVLTIDRKKWYRGKGGDGSKLLRHDGKMCCLGFMGKKLGYEDRKLKDYADPGEVSRDHSDGDGDWPDWLVQQGEITDDCAAMIRANDAKALKEAEREKRLRELFKKSGVTLRFIN